MFRRAFSAGVVFALALGLAVKGQLAPAGGAARAGERAAPAPRQAQYGPGELYLSYFSGHWCDCWRKQSIPIMEKIAAYKGVLPRGRTPPWGKNKLIAVPELSPAEYFAAQALAGNINRRRVMFYLRYRDDFWLRGTRMPWKEGVIGEPIRGPYQGRMVPESTGYVLRQPEFLTAIKRFITELQPPEIQALVIFDPALIGSGGKRGQARAALNVVRTMCGTEKAVALSPALYERLPKAGRVPQLPVLDTRQFKQWSLAAYNGDEEQALLATYSWALNNLWDRCYHRAAAFVPPSPPQAPECAIVDYVAQFALFCFHLPSASKVSERLGEMVLSKMPANSAIVGTLTTKTGAAAEEDEVRLLRLFSRFGKFFIDTKGARNLSFHSGHRDVGYPRLKQKRGRKLKFSPQKRYVAFCLTTRNSLGYFMSARAAHWDCASRGKIPLGWALPVAAADVCPQLLKYYYLTATENDCFVADWSGVGRMFPPNFGAAYSQPARVLEAFLQTTDRYMDLLDIHVLWAEQLDRASLDQFTGRLRSLDTLLYGTNPAGVYLHRTSYIARGKPVFHAFSAVHASKQVLRMLPTELAGRKQRFYFIGIDETLFSANEDVVALIAQAARSLGPEFVVVRPDQLGELFAQAVAAGRADGRLPEARQRGPARKGVVARVPARAISVDGILDEWRSLPCAPVTIARSEASAADGQEIAARVRLAYDEEYLYVAAEVNDDIVFVDDYNLAAGDGLELRLDGREDPFREPTPGEGFYELLLVPAAGLVRQAQVVLLYPTFDVGLASVNRQGITHSAASVRTRDGYIIEAAIPLVNFPRVRFAPGRTLFFGVALMDIDRDEARVRLPWPAENKPSDALGLPRISLS